MPAKAAENTECLVPTNITAMQLPHINLRENHREKQGKSKGKEGKEQETTYASC